MFIRKHEQKYLFFPTKNSTLQLSFHINLKENFMKLTYLLYQWYLELCILKQSSWCFLVWSHQKYTKLNQQIRDPVSKVIDKFILGFYSLISALIFKFFLPCAFFGNIILAFPKFTSLIFSTPPPFHPPFHVCVYMYVTGLHIHMEARGGCHVFSISPHLLPWDGTLTEPGVYCFYFSSPYHQLG